MRDSLTVLVANPSADLYGSDRMMLESVRGMRERGWRVVVVMSVAGDLVPELETTGAEVVVMSSPVVRRAHLTPRGVLTLGREIAAGMRPMWRLLGRVRPDLVYVSTVTVPLWLLLAMARRVPRVVHVHEAEASSPVARLGLALPNLLASGIIYNSETSAAVGRSGPARGVRSIVVHNGVPGPRAVTPPREELVGGPRLVYVGRLSPRKGVDLAVSALRQLLDAGVAGQLTLVGSVFPGYEWYEQQLRDLVGELDLADRVRFTGFQPEVWSWLAAGDIALVPSRGDESFGNTVVEAALSARPSIVADHSGLREASRGFASSRRVAPEAAALAQAVRSVVEGWSQVRAEAIQDAAWAASEFAPSRYRAEVTHRLEALARPSHRRVASHERSSELP